MKKIFFVLCFIVMSNCGFAQIKFPPYHNSFSVIFTSSPLNLPTKLSFSGLFLPFPYDFYTYKSTSIFYRTAYTNTKSALSSEEIFYKFRNDTISTTKIAENYYHNPKQEKQQKRRKFWDTVNTVLMYWPF